MGLNNRLHNGGPLLPPAGHSTTDLKRLAHLLLWVLEGDHQHHIASLELQLICVGGCVVVLSLYL
jgi:hypothetical protein